MTTPFDQWRTLQDSADIEALADTSHHTPCVIFKHSPRCTTSLMKHYTLSLEWPFAPDAVQAYLVDVVAQPHVAQAVSDFFQEHHQSPQVLLIRNGECIYEESQLDIDAAALADNLHNDW